jgi:hypothetical protein
VGPPNVLEEHTASIFISEVKSVRKWMVYIGSGEEGLAGQSFHLPISSLSSGWPIPRPGSFLNPM